MLKPAKILVFFTVFLAVSPGLADELAIDAITGLHVFQVEVPVSDKDKETGLMHRDSLPEDKGMLFVWPREVEVGMWMKNTLIPLDMLFINRAGKIIYIAENTTPLSLKMISADRPVVAVLEIAGGVVKKKQIRVGDKVIHSRFAP